MAERRTFSESCGTVIRHVFPKVPPCDPGDLRRCRTVAPKCVRCPGLCPLKWDLKPLVSGPGHQLVATLKPALLLSPSGTMLLPTRGQRMSILGCSTLHWATFSPERGLGKFPECWPHLAKTGLDPLESAQSWPPPSPRSWPNCGRVLAERGQNLSKLGLGSAEVN